MAVGGGRSDERAEEKLEVLNALSQGHELFSTGKRLIPVDARFLVQLRLARWSLPRDA